jgi:hypothetical protein
VRATTARPPRTLGLHRRGGGGRDEEGREGAQQARGGDIELGFEFVEMLVAALAGGEVHEIPGKERVGQGEVAVDAVVARVSPYRSTHFSR